MKVAITEGKGDVKIKEVPIPEINEYQCLCKVLACATCTGTDLKIIDGKMVWCKDYPVVLGHESVGIVIKKGKKVRYVKEGDIFFKTYMCLSWRKNKWNLFSNRWICRIWNNNRCKKFQRR